MGNASKFWILIVSTMLLLAACGSEGKTSESANGENTTNIEESEEQSSNNDREENTADDVDTEGNETTAEVEEEADVDQDVFGAKDKTENETEIETAENLLDKDKVFEYDDGSVVMTLETAEFVKKFGPSNVDPENTSEIREATADTEIYFHLTGTINNDTTKSFSFGNSLGVINFSLLYDDKHEFDNLSTAEAEGGTKLVGSNIPALTEERIHVYFKVPKPVSETDKPLVLTVLLGKEPYEITLR